MTEGAVDEGETFVGVRTVPGDEELHAVGVTDDRAGGQNDLTHTVDVILGDQILHAVDGAQREHQSQHHAET